MLSFLLNQHVSFGHFSRYRLNLLQPGVGNMMGVCTDQQRGGAGDDTIIDSMGSEVDGITIIRFNRTLGVVDMLNDAPIQDRVWEYMTSLHSSEDAFPTQSHTTRSNPLFFNFFQTPSCPVGNNGMECSGNGTCMNGCCVCTPPFNGARCDIDDNVGGGAVPDQIIPEDYQFTAVLSPDFTIYWNIEEDTNTILLAMECTGTGWCSFGPSTNDLMTDSDVVFGFVMADGTPVVTDRFITDRSAGCPGVCLDDDPTIGGGMDLLGSTAAEVNGRTQVIFRRLLDTGDSNGDISIIDGEMDAIFAYNPNDDGLVRHSAAPSDTANRLRINFFDGNVTLADDFRLVHGILMFLAWAVIIPITSCVARYLKMYTWWFPTHWGCNVLAMFMVIASFILIVINTTVHFTRAHHIIGLIIVFLMFVQIALGVLADQFWYKGRENTPFFPDKTHWILGFFLIIITLINILLGLLEFEASDTLTALYIVWAVLTVLISIGMALGFAFYKHKRPPAEEMKEDL